MLSRSVVSATAAALAATDALRGGALVAATTATGGAGGDGGSGAIYVLTW